MELTDSQWSVLEPFFAGKEPGGRGRPRRQPRPVVEGVLWVCRSGAPWKDLPGRYPPYQTCHRYFQRWNSEGVWDRVLRALADHLFEKGEIDIRECFIDGTFSSAKKGAIVLERLGVARAPRSWRSQTLMVFLSPYGPDRPTTTR